MLCVCAHVHIRHTLKYSVHVEILLHEQPYDLELVLSLDRRKEESMSGCQVTLGDQTLSHFILLSGIIISSFSFRYTHLKKNPKTILFVYLFNESLSYYLVSWIF